MTPGAPTLVFLNGRSVVAAVRCLLTGYVRCGELWEVDVQLLDSKPLTDVLIEFASNSVVTATGHGLPLSEIARNVRSEYRLSPASTYRALRQAGLACEDSKTAVDSTLNASEVEATEWVRTPATSALYQ